MPSKRKQGAFEQENFLAAPENEEPLVSGGGDAQQNGSNTVDSRNRLNELTNREWMIATKSVWGTDARAVPTEVLTEDDRVALADWLSERKGRQVAQELLEQLLPSVMYSRPPARDPLKSQHPATFAESDIERLIGFFTKRGQWVLDPFLGSGSTLVACQSKGRYGVGIELVARWAEIARKRIAARSKPLLAEIETEETVVQQVIQGDARAVLQQLDDGKFDLVVTSPPYWKILHKDKDHKVTRERLTKGLDTRYSEQEDDIGNIGSYTDFMSELGKVFVECCRVLRNGQYMCVIVSDFRDKGRFIPYHSDISEVVTANGFALQGITILVQDSKNLYPYGIPYAFVSNINHQYILVFRKNGMPTAG